RRGRALRADCGRITAFRAANTADDATLLQQATGARSEVVAVLTAYVRADIAHAKVAELTTRIRVAHCAGDTFALGSRVEPRAVGQIEVYRDAVLAGAARAGRKRLARRVTSADRWLRNLSQTDFTRRTRLRPGALAGAALERVRIAHHRRWVRAIFGVRA